MLHCGTATQHTRTHRKWRPPSNLILVTTFKVGQSKTPVRKCSQLVQLYTDDLDDGLYIQNPAYMDYVIYKRTLKWKKISALIATKLAISYVSFQMCVKVRLGKKTLISEFAIIIIFYRIVFQAIVDLVMSVFCFSFWSYFALRTGSSETYFLHTEGFSEFFLTLKGVNIKSVCKSLSYNLHLVIQMIQFFYGNFFDGAQICRGSNIPVVFWRFGIRRRKFFV